MRLVLVFKKYWLSLLAMTLTFFLCGFFLTEYVYNSLNARYVYCFNSTESDAVQLLNSQFYEDTFLRIDHYNEENPEHKISYATINYEELLNKAELNYESDMYQFSFLKKYFPNILKKNGTVNEGNNRVKNYFNLVCKYGDLDVEYKNIEIIKYQNPYLIGGICSGVFLCMIVLFSCFSMDSLSHFSLEDNRVIFKSVFHKTYWKSSLRFSKNVKSLCLISMLFALMLLCKFIPISSGFGSLGIGLTYLVFATICLIEGPVCGLAIGFCSDVLGHFMTHGGQAFFIGYTLDAMLSGFIYGLCFYKKRITFVNCLTARFFVNIVINVGLGCLWWKIIYQLDWNGYITYLTLTSLPKNILYLLPQSILLYLLFKLLAKPLAKFNLIDDRISESVSLF